MRQVEAAFSPNLPRSVLLGTDVVEFPQLLRGLIILRDGFSPSSLGTSSHHQTVLLCRSRLANLNRVNGDAVAIGGETVPEVIGEEMDPELFEGGRHKPI